MVATVVEEKTVKKKQLYKVALKILLISVNLNAQKKLFFLFLGVKNFVKNKNKSKI